MEVEVMAATAPPKYGESVRAATGQSTYHLSCGKAHEPQSQCCSESQVNLSDH